MAIKSHLFLSAAIILIFPAGVAKLAALTNLKHLKLEVQISDEGLVHLSNLRNLEVLKLPFAQIAGIGLVHLTKLPSLRRLELVGCPLTDDAVPYLCAMTSLRSLNIIDTLINPSGLKTLKEALPERHISYRKLTLTQN
jgi:hypothetical protein